jgi:hypothetical protein
MDDGWEGEQAPERIIKIKNLPLHMGIGLYFERMFLYH